MSNILATNKMEFPRNKATIGAIAMILLMAISAFAVAVPRTNGTSIHTNNIHSAVDVH